MSNRISDGLRSLLKATDRTINNGEYVDPADPSIVHSNHDPELIGDDEALLGDDVVVHVSFEPTSTPQEFEDVAVVLPFRMPQR